MKVSVKSFIMTTSILTWLLLGGFSCCGAQVTIIIPPQNTTICRGSGVTISCGYRSNMTFPVTWIINGTSFNQSAIESSSLYQLNNPTDPTRFSLTVFSVNGTTTFQCVIQSTPNTTSRHGTVVVNDARIITPPENKTVCGDDRVTISCGYSSDVRLPVRWKIDGVSYNELALENTYGYHLNNKSNPEGYSLTIYSVRYTTAIQCGICSPPRYSAVGTVTAVDKLKLDIVTARVGCGYFYLAWAINSNEEKCKVQTFEVHLKAPRYGYYLSTDKTFRNFTDVPSDAPLNVTVFGTNKQTNVVKDSVTTVAYDFVRTFAIRDPAPVMVTAVPNIYSSFSYINVTWQVPTCVKNITIIAYNIIVMDQYSPATVNVWPNVSSVVLSYLRGNGTDIRTNRIYTVTVLAISDQGTSYPSDPVVVSTYYDRYCEATSSSIGTITVSCRFPLEILVTLKCTNNCTIPELITYGSSPLTVRGLDPGVMYSVIINVFDGSHVVLNNQMEVRNITVMSDKSGTGGSRCEDSNVAAIVGGIMGGTIVMLMIIIIVLICCLISYKKKGKSAYDSEDLQRSPMLKTSNSY